MQGERDLIFVGTYGHVAAIDKRSGAELWRTSLPRGGFGLVSLLCEDGVLYAGAGGRLYALDQRTGKILWENGLEGLGMDLVCLATVRSTANAGADPLPQAAHAAARAASSAANHS